MKLMKKIVAAISAMTMILSISSMTYAYDGTLKLSATAEPVKAGETAKVVVSLDETAADGLWALTVDFKFNDTFTVPNIANSADCVLLTSDNSVNTQVVTGTNTYRFDWSDTFMDNEATAVKATGKLFTLDVVVPEGTAPGTYPITLDKEALYVIDCYWAEYDLELNADACITVISDAPAVVEAKIAPNEPIDGVKEVKEDGNTYFTKGLSATLTPGTETVTNVIATFFNKAGNEGKEKAEWPGSYEGETPITFAVNVLNVPDGEDVTATWEIVK